VRPVAAYPGWLLDALRRSAPVGAVEPVVVLLTPGVGNAAYFEHAFLPRKMGIELAEGRDLFCRDNIVYMRSVGGQRRVDVAYRRVNDDFLDPVHFRADSVVGVRTAWPGLTSWWSSPCRVRRPRHRRGAAGLRSTMGCRSGCRPAD
jgi:uncharacterized circularly permuted ATP-grasp superfamily protein